jgi:hypothetical protein
MPSKSRRGANFRKPVEPRHRRAAKRILEGDPIHTALLEAGYSDAVARMGRRALERPGPLRTAMLERLEKLALTPKFSNQEQQNIVVNQLLTNIARERDRATASLTALGRIRNMLQPENQTVIAISIPPETGAARQWLEAEAEETKELPKP